MTPDQLSQELRHETDGFLSQRRGIVGLAATAIGALTPVALYQMGLLRRIPEPPLPRLDADKVDASGEAYEKLSSPDAPIGIASYGVTMTLATMGGADRARTRPWIPLAMAGKVAVDAVQAGKLTWSQWARHKAFCSWCLTAAAATFAAVPLAVPEARAALRQVFKRRST